MILKNTKQQRKTRISRSITGTMERPRLSVYRSNMSLYAQIIDDTAKKTLVGISEKAIEIKGTKIEKAKALGMKLAELAKANKISKVAFDKGSYAYHGRVKAFAEGAREGGLQF